jgi:hypothetical protein
VFHAVRVCCLHTDPVFTELQTVLLFGSPHVQEFSSDRCGECKGWKNSVPVAMRCPGKAFFSISKVVWGIALYCIWETKTFSLLFLLQTLLVTDSTQINALLI